MAERRPPYDPGWNDPPTFNYSNAPPPTKTKLNLNKRIAFPMQTSGSSNSAELPKVEKSTAGLPMPFARVKSNASESNSVAPISNSVPLAPPPSMTNAPKSSEGCESIEKVSDETNNLGNSQELVMSILKDINKSLVSTDNTKVEEIEKRLSVLESMWTDSKIDDKLKTLLAKTARALQDNQFSVAIDLHRTIIVDHGANVCAQWGPALRQLILMKESKVSPKLESNPDAAVVDEPKFINPLEDENYGSSKTVGRVKHL